MASKKSKSHNNAVGTVGTEGTANKRGTAYEYKAKSSKHPLLKVAFGGYALNNTLNNHKLKKAHERVEKMKFKRMEYDEASRYFSRGPGSDSLGNVFSDAFSRALMKVEMEDAMRKLHKYEKRKARAQKVGQAIGSVLNMARESGRTMAMKSAVSDTKGAVNGIDREDITQTAAAVATASMDEGQIEF